MYINRKKSQIRKPRIDHAKDFKVLNEHGKKFEYIGGNIEEDEILNKKYEDLRVEIFEDVSPKVDKRNIQTLRKRKERLKKQINKLKN